MPNANNLDAEDISTIPTTGGKVGVLWSNQATAEMRFAVHADTAPDQTWTSTVLCAATKCPTTTSPSRRSTATGRPGVRDRQDLARTSRRRPPAAGLRYHIDMSTPALKIARRQHLRKAIRVVATCIERGRSG